MTGFSKLEWQNVVGAGFVEEEALLSLEHQASLFGAISTLTFEVSNGQRDNPIMRTGTHTAGASSTTLTDSAADFIDAMVTPGDLVINTSDGDAEWEVTAVVSATALTVRLRTSGGAGDDFQTSDAYDVRKRNRADIYIPKQTEIQVTGRDINKVFFVGKVMEALSEGEFGERLRVIVTSYDAELRDGKSLHDRSGATPARSEAVRLVPTEQHTGAAEGSGPWVLPHISFFEGAEGIEHSMNFQTVSPDGLEAVRNQLAELLDLAREDQWAPAALREPAIPVQQNAVHDEEQELVYPSAQGNLAQSFTPTSHYLVTAVTLRLRRYGNITGNMYARLEANDRGGDAARLDVTSGELAAPWAESELVNLTDAPVGSNALVTFKFPQPVALSSGSTYWIVLAYQEGNTSGYNTGVDYIAWRDDSAAGFGAGAMATYSSPTWTVDATKDFAFQVIEHLDAVYFYDVSGNTWEDQTTKMLADDANRGKFLDLVAGGGAAGDRMYIRTAGPIRGIELQVENTLANVEYGTITVRYWGSTRPKAGGQHTTTSSATILTDADMDFRRLPISTGDLVRNLTDGSYGVITVIAKTTLTVGDLLSGVADVFNQGHIYEVVNLEQVAAGTQDGGSSAIRMTDSSENFLTAGVREGDILVNVTDNLAAVITAYTATTIDTVTGMSWDDGDTFRVYSRWRTVALKLTSPTFLVANTVRLEWEIESDWEAESFVAGFPEASAPGAATADIINGFWITIQSSVQPGTAAEVDLITPLPGHGYSLLTSPRTHDDSLIYAGAHDGGNGAANLIDTSEDFIADHGVLVGDVVENITDGSSGTVTAIQTTTGINDTLVMTLSGGANDDWTDTDIYRIRRTRQRLSYFRNGSRPWGGAAAEGLTVRQGGPDLKQIWGVRTPKFSRSHRSGVNRVRVVGRAYVGGAKLEVVVNDIAAQRELGQVIMKVIVDFSIHSTAEATDRGNAELARLSYPARRGFVRMFRLPYSQRIARRISWFESGTGAVLGSEMDGAIYATLYDHTAGTGANLIDTDTNFKKWGIEVGDLVYNLDDGSTGAVTAISTTTNENDTLEMALSGGTNDEWANGDEYRVEKRRFVQVGDLVKAKAEDPTYIDADYLVVAIEYREPEFVCVLRLSRNFQAPSQDDQQTAAELFGQVSDEARMGLQFGAY